MSVAFKDSSGDYCANALVMVAKTECLRASRAKQAHTEWAIAIRTSSDQGGALCCLWLWGPRFAKLQNTIF